jgi:hypothetical protein
LAARNHGTRLDQLERLLPPEIPDDRRTLGDTLDAISDPEARAMLTRCAVILLGADDAGSERPEDILLSALAARWLHAALFTDRFDGDPSTADLLSLVSPGLTWIEQPVGE